MSEFSRVLHEELIKLGCADEIRFLRELSEDGGTMASREEEQAAREVYPVPGGAYYYNPTAKREKVLEHEKFEQSRLNITANGEQIDFGTGATRSTDEGKIDFEGHLSPEVFQVFGEYMNRHRIQRDGQLRASDNWQRGIPTHRYVKSLIRHTFEFWRMWRGHAVTNPDNGQPFTFADVLCAVMFNVMGIIFEMATQAPDVLKTTYMPTEIRKAIETEKEGR